MQALDKCAALLSWGCVGEKPNLVDVEIHDN